MNPIAEEIASIMTNAEDDSESLEHYGTPRRSGRYPWGSGKDPQRNPDFLSRVEELRKQNYTYTDPKTGEVYTGDKAIYKKFRMSSGEFRTVCSVCLNERKAIKMKSARTMFEDGLGYTEIGRRLGEPEGTIRGWIKKPNAMVKPLEARKTADFLKQKVDERGMIDVGKGEAARLGVSDEQLKKALYILKQEGYPTYGGRIQTGDVTRQTTQTVLCPPGTQHKDIFKGEVHSVDDFVSTDGGDTFKPRFQYPKSMDLSRLHIRYKNETDSDGFTGEQKDGLIEIRRGVKDLDLGNDRYAQVRILVDDKYYLKGMAAYSDDIPDGVDVVFNSNRTPDKALKDVLKEIKKGDPTNPFGSTLKDQGGQYTYTDKDGKEQLGLINKTRGEGDWSEWSDALPAQFLSKQSTTLARKQLDEARQEKLKEFQEICALDNPTIKKYYLGEFASKCDGAAKDLKAAALPGQKHQVVIPINTLSDKEVYAPRFADGTMLALVRFPHAGRFEIPILKVNNKDKLARKIISPDGIDAVGVNSTVASILSGADFDGDSVMCIPTHNGKVKIENQEPLDGLKGFNTKEYQYAERKTDADGRVHYYNKNGLEFKTMKDDNTGKDNTQNEMGRISNLITDMTLLGATDAEMVRAVKHSMVVIDAKKHYLDYKQSEKDNDIASLRKIYQQKYDEDGVKLEGKAGGASTIVSRAKGQWTVIRRQGSPKINNPDKPWYDPDRPEGALIYKDSLTARHPVYTTNKAKNERTYTTIDRKKITISLDDKEAYEKYKPVAIKDKTGKIIRYTNKDGSIEYKTEDSTQKSTRMDETDDARTLMSVRQHPMEVLYADYANSMKALANEARMTMVRTKDIAYDAAAKVKYQEEAHSLDEKYKNAIKNAPVEREVMRRANATLRQRVQETPDMTKSDQKKQKDRLIKQYREELGSVSRKNRNIDITDREWEAIQAGAISATKLRGILANSDPDKLKERAMPRTSTTLSAGKIARLNNMRGSGLTIQQMADALGVSTSTITKYLKGGNE